MLVLSWKCRVDPSARIFCRLVPGVGRPTLIRGPAWRVLGRPAQGCRRHGSNKRSARCAFGRNQRITQENKNTTAAGQAQGLRVPSRTLPCQTQRQTQRPEAKRPEKSKLAAKTKLQPWLRSELHHQHGEPHSRVIVLLRNEGSQRRVHLPLLLPLPPHTHSHARTHTHTQHSANARTHAHTHANSLPPLLLPHHKKPPERTHAHTQKHIHKSTHTQKRTHTHKSTHEKKKTHKSTHTATATYSRVVGTNVCHSNVFPNGRY